MVIILTRDIGRPSYLKLLHAVSGVQLLIKPALIFTTFSGLTHPPTEIFLVACFCSPHVCIRTAHGSRHSLADFFNFLPTPLRTLEICIN